MHPYGALCLVPPVVAVVLAIATRRVLPSVLVGLFAGALITRGGDPVAALVDLGEAHLWPTFTESSKLRLFAFTMAMGATIGLLGASGAMRGLVGLVKPLARGPRSGQLAGWAMGLLVFFDDYANTLLLGGALRPVYDRLRLSREKLAYIVDSTAAPVAGLALVSTWIAVEVDYLQQGLDNLPGGAPEGVGAFALFVACIPYRFYVIQALVFVALVAVMNRDFGPMLAAERAARRGRREASADASPDAGDAAPWWVAVAPLALTLGTVTALLWATGVANLGPRYDPSAPLFDRLRDVFGAAESGLALMYGGLAGLASALLLIRGRGLLSPGATRDAVVRGVLTVLPAVGILWFAGAMSRMTGNRGVDGAPTPADKPYAHAAVRLYTGEYLFDQLVGPADSRGNRPAPSATLKALLPTGVFCLSCVVAFCTGTSFGTMGLVIPLTVPIAYLAASGGPADPTATPMFLAAIGGVLAGAIFGDHCSPISDTTILSASASGCDLMAHTWTQLPYALVVAAASILLGTLPLALGASVWLLLPVQSAALAAALWWFGKDPG